MPETIGKKWEWAQASGMISYVKKKLLFHHVTMSGCKCGFHKPLAVSN